MLPAVPFYHVNGWGLPFAAAMAGANIVLAGNSFKPQHLDMLIRECGVTLGAGVPTIWSDLIDYRETRQAPPVPALRRVATGGAVVPQRLVAGFAALGVDVIQAWGMTETSSMSVIGLARPSADGMAGGPPPVGQVVCGLELRVVEPGGGALPRDGAAVGEIQIRGPWVTMGYLGQAGDDAFDAGWLRTGDIGTIDGEGQLRLTDRLKDAVKSGGEWIPCQMLEDALRAVAGIADAAIIGRPDDRWQERPLAALVLAEGGRLDVSAIRDALRERIPAWWIPDSWALVEALPRTTLGKPDKARLRKMLADGELLLTEKEGPVAPSSPPRRSHGGR
jgi:fatty-acyl-CoA synthase